MSSHPTKWKLENLREAVINSSTLTDVCNKLGILSHGGNRQTVQRWIRKLQLDTTHFSNDKKLAGLRQANFNRQYKDGDIFKKDCIISLPAVRKRAKLLIPYMCECGNVGNWKNQKLELQLDHINGDKFDNRKSNLRWICPNCHSQTLTYCGRNKKVY